MSIASFIVTIAALLAGSICFFLYVYTTVASVRARAAALKPGAATPPVAAAEFQNHAVNVEEIGKLAEAIAKLTDSLSRASPSLTSLIGALIFFAIAAVSSGALRG